MNVFKRLSIIYILLTVLLASVVSYLDYNDLISGHNYHQLSTYERRAVDIATYSTIVLSPTSVLFTSYIPNKRGFRKGYELFLWLFISIPFSYIFYVFLFGGKSKLKLLITRDRI